MSTVVVDLTRRDLVAFTLRWLTGWPRVWPTFLFIFLLVAAFVVYKHGVPKTAWNWFALFVAGVGGGVGALVLGLIFSMIGIALHAGRIPGMLGRHEYAFVADGLLEKTEANETLIKWGGAHALIHTDTFLQIEIAPGLAHILPLRSFEDHNDFERFCRKAEQLVKQHAQLKR